MNNSKNSSRVTQVLGQHTQSGVMNIALVSRNLSFFDDTNVFNFTCKVSITGL